MGVAAGAEAEAGATIELETELHLCYVLYVTLERWPCSRYPIELCRQTDLAIIVGMAEGTHCTPSLSARNCSSSPPLLDSLRM